MPKLPLTPAELLAAYDQQLRGPAAFATTPGAMVVREGPVVRASGMRPRGMVTATGIDALGPAAVDRLIAHEVEVFSNLGQSFEWKTWSHDHPEEFTSRLEAAGFVRGEAETVLIAAGARVSRSVQLPPGAAIREIRTASEFARLGVQLGEVWGEDQRQAAQSYREAVLTFPDQVVVMVIEVDGEVVASGRCEFVAGTDFCTLWGGSTLPQWRGRGLYRALVARRAQLGVERGYRLLAVDALPTSLPTLERLGFVAITTSTPFIWDRPESR